MLGKSRQEAEAELQKSGMSPEQIAHILPHKVRPVSHHLGDLSISRNHQRSLSVESCLTGVGLSSEGCFIHLGAFFFFLHFINPLGSVWVTLHL